MSKKKSKLKPLVEEKMTGISMHLDGSEDDLNELMNVIFGKMYDMQEPWYHDVVTESGIFPVPSAPKFTGTFTIHKKISG